MFWARRQALAPLFNAGITLDDFPVEAGQTDGTLAHCMERLFGLSSSRQGLPVAVLRDEEFTSWSPWRFDQYTDRSYGPMLRSFQDPAIKLIGFDIFDTLLCRPLLDPESIKTIVARRFGEALGQQYMQFRPLAEQQARRQKGADVSLDEIYASLTVLTNIPSPALLEIKKIELSVETSSLSPRPGALNLFKDAVATGKPVALITDMFLPRSSIETTLKNFGFDGWSGFYVSGEIGLRKDAGSLYLHVLEHFHVKPSEFLMVGDNERSDIQIPSDMGASFLHLLKPVELARGLPRFASFIHDQERSKDLEAELTLGLVVKENFSPISYEAFDPESLFQVDPHAQGYSVIGPLLAAFSQWLLEASRQDNIERLYFLSREGRLMKEAFDLWCKEENRLPATEYLVVSRRAAGAAAIFAFEDILEVARIDYFPNTAENFLNTRYGLLLDDDRWEDLEKKIGWKKKTSVQVTEKNIDAVMPLLNFLKAEILARAEVEREALIRLLAEKGLDQNDHQAVVDIGFGGSVQRYLNKLLSRKVHGYYMITDERAGAVASACNVFLKGCFLEQVQRNDAAPMLYRRSFNLEKYLSSGEPQLEFYEIDSSGCVTGHFHDLTDQEKSMLQLRKDIHKGALDYVADSLHIRSTMLPDFRPSIQISSALAQAFLTWNSPGELNFLSQILLDDYYCGRGLVL
jgi:predicted HAD superfamily hydrolase